MQNVSSLLSFVSPTTVDDFARLFMKHFMKVAIVLSNEEILLDALRAACFGQEGARVICDFW